MFFGRIGHISAHSAQIMIPYYLTARAVTPPLTQLGMARRDCRSSLLYGLDPQKRATIVIRQQVKQAVRALANLADA